MKSKFLFAAAIAAMTASCTQESIEAPVSNLGERVAIESPSISIAKDAVTRMTTMNEYAGVKWLPGDGFGAMLVDQVNNISASSWAGKYTITPDVKASNYLFAYEVVDGNAMFTTEAEMVEGNYIFYAPFNVAEDNRSSLTIKTPLVQEIKPSQRNSALTNFFEDKTSPVFVAYKDLHAGTDETEIGLDMYHIFGIPMVTLDNQYKTGAGTEEDPFVYHDLTVNKIVLKGTYMKDAKIDNDKVFSKLNIIGKAKSAWKEDAYENAYTADLYTSCNTASGITLNFSEGGLKVAKQTKEKFFIVIPAADYNAGISAEFYVTINGQEKKFASDITTNKAFTLTAGLPYAAQEYNADGTIKQESKGSSFTFTMTGTLTDVSTPTIPVDGIENVDQLTAYIKNVAYRGGNIAQVATEEAAKADPTTKFFIKDNHKVTINDEFINAVANSLIVNGNGSVSFLDSDKVQLGNISQDYTLGGKIQYAATTLNSVGTLTTVIDNANLNVLSGTVTATADRKYTITNNGGTVVVPGAPTNGSVIRNYEGKVKITGNLNDMAALTIENDGYDHPTDDTKDKIAYVEIASGKTSKCYISNCSHGYIQNYGYLYSVDNGGVIEMMDVNAGVDVDVVDDGGIIINNVQCPYVTFGGPVTATFSSIPSSIVANINTIYLNNSVELSGDEFTAGKVFANIGNVNVKAGKTITTGTLMQQPANNVTFNVYETTGSVKKYTWTSGHPMLDIDNDQSTWVKKYTVNGATFEHVTFN